MPTIADMKPIVPKILLWGRPGTGKTPFVCSYGAKMQLIDTDRGLLSAAKISDKWTTDRLSVDVVECLENEPSKALAFPKFKETVMSIYNSLTKGTYPFEILAVDSFTTIADFALRYIQGNSASFGKAITQQQWGLAINEIDNVFMWLKAMPIPVVVIFHAKEGLDHTEHPTEEIAIFGKNLPSKLMSYFDEIICVKTRLIQGKPESYLRTLPEAYTTIRSRACLKDNQLCSIGFRDLINQLGWKTGGASTSK